MTLTRAHRIHVQRTKQMLDMETCDQETITVDMATVDFRNAAYELLPLSSEELRRRLPEFGPALSALIHRVASLGER